MTDDFLSMLAVGGRANSLGRAEEVVQIVLHDHSRLEELYQCLFADDAWVRMRGVDTLEKVCRVHPKWIEPYIDRFFKEIATSAQPSIQWHFAEMLGEVALTEEQMDQALTWLTEKLQTLDVDWIVSGNAMNVLAQFTNDGRFPKQKLIFLLEVQQEHRSKAVRKRATKLLENLEDLS